MNNSKMQKMKSVLSMLYLGYRERHPMDTEEITAQFASLADVLNKLPLKEHDRVWDLACSLCAEHEKMGFLAGVRTGIFLAAELAEHNE